MPDDAPARVGDRDEEVARALVGPGRLEGGLDAGPGVGEEGQRLGRRARLRGHDPERRQRVEVVDDRRDRARIGRVEDPQVQVALRRAERPVEDLRGEARAAHAHDDRGPEAGHADPVPEALEGRDLVGEVGRRIEPAEALGDRRRGRRLVRPEAGVPVQEPARPLLAAGVGRDRGEALLVGRGQAKVELRTHPSTSVGTASEPARSIGPSLRGAARRARYGRARKRDERPSPRPRSRGPCPAAGRGAARPRRSRRGRRRRTRRPAPGR